MVEIGTAVWMLCSHLRVGDVLIDPSNITTDDVVVVERSRGWFCYERSNGDRVGRHYQRGAKVWRRRQGRST